MADRPLAFVTAILIAASLSSATALAHEHDHDAPAGGVLGEVHFPNSCRQAVQQDLQRGIAMLHSFWYSEGLATFRSVLEKDPDCVTAAWGAASVLMNNPLAGQGATTQAAADAQRFLEQGRKSTHSTPRERAYLEAVAAYYKDFADRPESSRQQTRADAYTALAAKYPEDDEAQIFHALYLAGTQSQADQTYAAYLEAAALLEKQFVKYPQHPGIAHYLIHSYDAPPIASKGLNAAERYAAIAPAAPHALHMPSHIFTRVGDWKQSVATNQRSFDTAVQSKDADDAMHAADYKVYAHLQQAQDLQAQAALDAALKVDGTTNRLAAPYALAAMPARIALERGDWEAATHLKVMKSALPFTEGMTHFARALGFARTGNVAQAESEAKLLEAVHSRINGYWQKEVEVQQLAAAAWIAQARGNAEDALKLMKTAADVEDRNEKHIVTPGRLVPARELYGELLMAQKKPAQALQEFELSQQREPNRFRGYLGVARAAAAVGDDAKAARSYAKMTELAADGGAARPELAEARQFTARK
jgi:tetratricopeptide (TPR) repeat protein